MSKHTPKTRWTELFTDLPYFDGMCEVLLSGGPQGDRRCHQAAVVEQEGFAVCRFHAVSESRVAGYTPKAGEFRFGHLLPPPEPRAIPPELWDF